MNATALLALERLQQLLIDNKDALADIAIVRNALSPPSSIVISATSPKVTSTIIQNMLRLDLTPLKSSILSPPQYWNPVLEDIQPSSWLIQTLSSIDQPHRLAVDAIVLESMKKVTTEKTIVVPTGYRLHHQLVTMSAQVNYVKLNRPVIIETVCEVLTEKARLQLLWKLGALFESKKKEGEKHPGVYGVLANCHEFEFWRVTDESVVSRTEPLKVSKSLPKILYMLSSFTN